MGGIKDRNLEANLNDGNYPGLGSKAFKNLIDNDPDGFFALDGSLRFTFADGATESKTWTPDLASKVQVIGVTLVKTDAAGNAGDTVQVFSGANAVTEAMSLGLANKAVSYGAQLDTARNLFTNTVPIIVTRTKTSQSNAACIVYLKVARSA